MDEQLRKEYDMLNLPDAAKKMKEIKEALDFAKAHKTELQEKYDHLRLHVIPDLMDAGDIGNVTYEGLGRVGLTGDVYASIPADNREKAYKWLRKHKHGELIQETVNSGTLKAFAKRMLAKGKPLPEKIFKVTPYSRATITKVNK